MISVIYILASLSMLLLQVKLAAIVPKKYGFVLAFMLLCSLTGVIHYRVFLNGNIFGVDLSNLYLSLFALIMFVLTVFIPVGKLTKRRT